MGWYLNVDEDTDKKIPRWPEGTTPDDILEWVRVNQPEAYPFMLRAHICAQECYMEGEIDNDH